MAQDFVESSKRKKENVIEGKNSEPENISTVPGMMGYPEKRKKFDFVREEETDEHKCRCEFVRSLIYCTKSEDEHRRFKTRRQLSRILQKLAYHFCPTSNKSIKFFFYAFTIWTLMVAPLLNELLRFSLPFRQPISLGGVMMVQGCHPGSTTGGGTRPRPAVNLVPFQRNEFVPKISEQTIGASGPAEGPIYRDTPRYHTELEPNLNPDIFFRDEERTNEDRMMTQRCKDRLNVLAIWVINQWPGIKLRVTEGWDDPGVQSSNNLEKNLHYEGRAVDITTSDQDQSKYPILARLAVEAGFDWVIYKKSHVHCSVKSESSGAPGNRGCFPGESRVFLPGKRSARIDELKAGDPVYSVGSDGRVVLDTILTFMDVRHDVGVDNQVAKRSFVSITTESGHRLRLTRNHLVHKRAGSEQTNSSAIFHLSPVYSTATFAGNIQVGDFIYTIDDVHQQISNAIVRPTKVIKVERVAASSGAYAPLTSRGTILVDGTMASCYAVIESESIAHLVMSPVRYYHLMSQWIATQFLPFDNSFNATESSDQPRTETGILPYARFLYQLGYHLIPEPLFWGD